MKENLITEVSIYPLKPKNGLICFASCLYDNKLSLNSMAIYTRPNGNGYRVVYPSKILPNGKEINIFYPVNRESAETIRTAIVGKFEELAEKVKGETRDGQKCPR